jgi:fibronectin type 3 domain-containing protein
MRLHYTIKTFLFCQLFFLAIVSGAHAQRRDTAGIMLVGRAQPYSIMLRWAVTKPAAWKLHNQHGFELLRYTVMRGGKVLSHPELKVISSSLRPAPLPEWEQIAQKDNYAAVIAQAIYGKDFEVSGGNSGIAKLINQSQELEQRFALSLFAADNSFPAAVMAGWGYEDKTARPDEKYLYRLRSLVPPGRYRADSAGVFIGIQDYQELPVPPEPGAVFSDKNVILSWDYSILKAYYNSWYVERSKDGGKSFERATNLPVTPYNQQEKRPSNRMYFVDSLQDNLTEYQYRLRGVSPFGETGPASKPVGGRGKQLLAYVPNIRSNEVDEKGILHISWEFDPAGDSLITGFTLSQAPGANGPYKPVIRDIPAAARKWTYDKLNSTNYFTITAVAKEGASATSFPVLVQPVDSVAPAPPTGLKATIDSNGVVTLSWNANTEKDILGYKVFRGDYPTQEFSPLVDSVYYQTTYKDSVTIRSLNSKVYYKVAALDQRFNQSVMSVVLEAKKPDVVPPSSPVMTDYKVEKGQVRLSWIRSSAEDVAAHILYRKEGSSAAQAWTALQQFRNNEQYYADATAEAGKTYSYILLARDSSGLESKPTMVVTVSVPVLPGAISIQSFNYYINRDQRYIELFWKDNIADVSEYQVYKREKGKAMTLWKVVPAGVKRITDEQLSANTDYDYSLRAVLKNGATGKYSSLSLTY